MRRQVRWHRVRAARLVTPHGDDYEGLLTTSEITLLVLFRAPLASRPVLGTTNAVEHAGYACERRRVGAPVGVARGEKSASAGSARWFLTRGSSRPKLGRLGEPRLKRM